MQLRAFAELLAAASGAGASVEVKLRSCSDEAFQQGTMPRITSKEDNCERKVASNCRPRGRKAHRFLSKLTIGDKAAT